MVIGDAAKDISQPCLRIDAFELANDFSAAHFS
jgi:hypothetical protein